MHTSGRAEMHRAGKRVKAKEDSEPGSSNGDQAAGTSQLQADRVTEPSSKDLPAWAQPHVYFTVVSSLYWGVMLITYVLYRYQHLAGNANDLQQVPCNPSKRVTATCAHRGNAAELLGPSAAGRHATRAPLVEQMTAVWQHGITCVDFDVVQLAGGEMVVGHPVDLVAIARSSSNKGPALTPGLLHKHTLAELRAAGVDADAAPLLHTLVRHFAELRRNQPSSTDGSSSSSSARKMPVVQANNERRNWQQVPVLNIELKGPAANNLDSWREVITTAKSAGVAESLVLWLRQQPGVSSSNSGEQRAILQLAKAVKDAAISSGSSSKHGGGAGNVSRPLVGLIVPDILMQQLPPSSAAAAGSHSSQMAALLLKVAAGVGGTSRGKASSSSSNGSLADTATVLDVFDTLAPSIKLPPSVLAELAALKSIFTWTLGTEQAAIRKAIWLGLDVGINDQPLQQKKYVQQTSNSICAGTQKSG